MGNSSSPYPKIGELNMLERMAISNLAEKAFKKNIKDTEGLEGKDMEYISGLGQEAEKLFYEYIQLLENKKKFPKTYQMNYSSRMHPVKRRF
ncbi:MAG: hypothetical protein ABIH28_01265 [archaeon]